LVGKYEELYDLEVDPDQVINLADDPSQQAPMNAMTQARHLHLLDH
jgi:hypothetical protein